MPWSSLDETVADSSHALCRYASLTAVDGELSQLGNTLKADHGGCMQYQAINFADKLSRFSDHWQPRVVAEMNDYQFKIVKIQGDFIWHDHPDTDETFIVIEGRLRIDLPDGHVEIGAGEMFVVPRGI
jgi:homogentisate 1,2-dioxygenase